MPRDLRRRTTRSRRSAAALPILAAVLPGALLAVSASPAAQQAAAGAAGTASGLAAAADASSPTPSPSLTPGFNLLFTVTPQSAEIGGTVTLNFAAYFVGQGERTPVYLTLNLPSGLSVSGVPTGCELNNGCLMGLAYPGGPPVSFQLTATASAAGEYPISAQWNDELVNDPFGYDVDATASATVDAVQPAISVLPPVGAPGTVALVRGTGFPPGEAITLAWQPGIAAGATPPVAAADGTFAAQILVLPGDQIGPRTVVASGTGFLPVDAPFLVTKARLLPPLLEAEASAAAGGSGTG